MAIKAKIRSIYSTALTKLLLDSGHRVVEPSVKIRRRFSLEPCDEAHDVLLMDRDDFQGLDIYGEAESICRLLDCIRKHLLDAVLVELDQDDSDDGLMSARMELPGASKEALDHLRCAVTPTLLRHHRLRIVDSTALERAEGTLSQHPDKKGELEKDLFLQAIFAPLEKAGVVRVEHVRPSGKSMRPREGVLVNATPESILFRRSFSKGGTYDGLDVPIQAGDYGLTTIREGAWFVKHAYYTKDDKLIGEYYNVNTPVELYPYGARYLDLEVDVVKKAGRRPRLLDREKLALLSRRGAIGSALESKAMAVAGELMQTLTG